MVIVDQYSKLLVSQHSDKPKFRAMVEAVCQGYVDQQNLLLSMPSKFDLNTAQESQLNDVGLWVGLSRAIRAPLPEVWFSLDDDDLGLDESIWFNSFTPTYGKSEFDDQTYRLLLRAKIAANRYQGNLPSMVEILEEIFSPATVVVTDNMDMTVDVTITGTPPNALFKELVLGGYMPLKPSGVKMTYSFEE